MSTEDIRASIEAEMQGMSQADVIRELIALKEKKAKQRERSTQTKEQRHEAYLKAKAKPGWAEKRQAQADKRKAKAEALLAIAKKAAESNPEIASLLQELGA
jgi:hypothetical protein